VATAQDKKSAFIYLDCHRRDINRRHDLCLLLAGETQQKKNQKGVEIARCGWRGEVNSRARRRSKQQSRTRDQVDQKYARTALRSAAPAEF
jgi:hypothetical protein